MGPIRLFAFGVRRWFVEALAGIHSGPVFEAEAHRAGPGIDDSVVDPFWFQRRKSNADAGQVNQGGPRTVCRSGCRQWTTHQLRFRRRRCHLVDPFLCPNCGGTMVVVGVIEDPGKLKAIIEWAAAQQSALPEARGPPISNA